MTDPRLEIAKIITEASFDDLRSIATSLHDTADDRALLQAHVDPINLVEFLYDWSVSVIEYEEEQAAAEKEAK